MGSQSYIENFSWVHKATSRILQGYTKLRQELFKGSQSCIKNFSWVHKVAGRSAFAHPWEGVHRSMSQMSSSLLLEQCATCLVRLILIVFVMGGRWPYSCSVVGCCLLDLFNIARSILV